MQEVPEINSVWIHTSGTEPYIVLLITNLDATKDDYPVTVVYQGTDGKVWSRKLSDWHRSMTPKNVP